MLVIETTEGLLPPRRRSWRARSVVPTMPSRLHATLDRRESWTSQRHDARLARKTPWQTPGLSPRVPARA